jgi:O-antigen ligase
MKVSRTVDVLSIFDLLFLPLLFLWSVRKFSSRERIFFPSYFKRPLMLLLVGATIATVFATDVFASLYGILIALRFYLLFRLVLDIIENIDQLRMVLLLLAVGLVFSSTIGVIQGVLGVNIRFTDVELNPNTAAAIGGRTVVRTIGTFANSLNFANYVSVTLFTVVLVRFRSSSLRRVAIALFVLLGVVALLQTLSRGPVLAAAVGGLVFWGVDFKKHRMPWLVVTTTLVSSLIVMPVFGSRVAQSVLGESLFVRFGSIIESYDLNIRYSLWLETAKELEKHVVGVGLRNSDYEVAWPQAAKAIPGYFPYETRGWKPFNFHFENVYLAVYMNIGLVGLAGFLMLVFRTVALPFSTLRGLSPSVVRQVCRVLVAANACFAVNMLTNPAILSDVRIMILFWTLVSCVAVLSKISSNMQTV